MTSEVIVANKSCIAIAADSASTVGRKILGPAQKIFLVSNNEPIAAIVFGVPEFLSVPFSLLFEYFRLRQGGRAYETVESCLDDFISFLESDMTILRPEQERRWLRNSLREHIGWMEREIDKRRIEILEQRGRLEFEDYLRCNKEGIGEVVRTLSAQPDLYTWDPDENLDSLFEDEGIGRLIEDFSSRYSLNRDQEVEVTRVGRLLISKSFFLDATRIGVVFVGLGRAETWPNWIEIALDGRIEGFLKAVKFQKDEITIATPAKITAFPQKDVVKRFVSGIGEDFEENLVRGFRASLERWGITNTERTAEEFGQLLGIIKKGESEPVMKTVRFMSIEQQIRLAEGLVRMTCIKREFTADELETVREPILVAIITKKDGFRWVRGPEYEL